MEKPKIYPTVKSCIDDTKSKEDCEGWYNTAFQEYLDYAPRYGSEDLCKKEGSETCLEVGIHPDSIWLPKMVGFTNWSEPLYLASASTSNPNDRVVAKPSRDSNGGFIVLGSYYSGGSAGRPYGLSEGMDAARTSGTANRVNAVGVSRFSSSSSSGRIGSVSRGGFGSRVSSGG